MLETGKAYSYEEILKLMEQDYEITPEILSKITNFPADFIRNPKETVPCLSNRELQEKHLYLMDAMMFILSGFNIAEDDYLHAHMLAFEKFGIKRSAIAKYVGTSEESLAEFYRSPASVPFEEKYKIAVRFLAFEWFLSKRLDFHLEENTEARPFVQAPDEVIDTVTFEITL